MERLICIAAVSLMGSGLEAQRVVPIGPSMEGQFGVFDMVVYDGALVVAGWYRTFAGHERPNIQLWDGTDHYDLPGAFEQPSAAVYAVEVHEGNLYASGYDLSAGSIARWDGSSWAWLPTAPNNLIRSMVIHGGDLYCGGQNGQIYRLQGDTWLEVGSALNGSIQTLVVHEGELFAGGIFTGFVGSAGPAKGVVRWNGSEWNEYLTGLNGPVRVMCSTSEGLVIAGEFTMDGAGVHQFQGNARVVADSYVEQPFFEDLGEIIGLTTHPDGGYMIGGESTYHVVDGQTVDIPFHGTRVCVSYEGRVILGGFRGSWSSYRRTGGIGELVEGTDRAYLDLGGLEALCMPLPAMLSRNAYQGFSHFSGLEAPKGTGRYPLLFTTPWVVAEVEGVTHSSIPLPRGAQGDSMWVYAGPTSGNMDEEHIKRYHQVWKLDRAQVLAHGTSWNSPGYSAPYAISNWPGNGDGSGGIPEMLAPYVDVDGNGSYEPQLGDLPAVLGDQGIYWIMHTEEDAVIGTARMDLDMHVQMYAYHAESDPAIRNTVFLNYKVINRSPHTYTDMRFGQFALFDIGCDVDDRLECDSTRSLFLGYNGDAFDEDCNGKLGYGSTPTAMGIKFLDHRMTSHRTTIPLGEFSDPGYIADLLQGTQGGAPYEYNGQLSNFQFPGGANGDAWNFYLLRGAVGAFGIHEFAPGDTLCVDLAFIFAQPLGGEPYSSVEMLKLRADSVQTFYDARAFDCSGHPMMTVTTEEADMGSLQAFPNPVQEVLTISANERLGHIRLIDAQGRLLRSRHSMHRTALLDMSSIPAGVYFLEVHSSEGPRTVRVMKQ